MTIKEQYDSWLIELSEEDFIKTTGLTKYSYSKCPGYFMVSETHSRVTPTAVFVPFKTETE